MVKKARHDDPVETGVFHMADDLNQFFAEDIGTNREAGHGRRLVRRLGIESFQDDERYARRQPTRVTTSPAQPGLTHGWDTGAVGF